MAKVDDALEIFVGVLEYCFSISATLSLATFSLQLGSQTMGEMSSNVGELAKR